MSQQLLSKYFRIISDEDYPTSNDDQQSCTKSGSAVAHEVNLIGGKTILAGK